RSCTRGAYQIMKTLREHHGDKALCLDCSRAPKSAQHPAARTPASGVSLHAQIFQVLTTAILHARSIPNHEDAAGASRRQGPVLGLWPCTVKSAQQPAARTAHSACTHKIS